MGTVKQFIESIKSREGLRFDGQVANLIGISRSKLANWKIRNSLPVEYQKWFCDKYDIELKDFHSALDSVNKQTDWNKGDKKSDSEYIIQLQKDKIESVEKKLTETKSHLDFIKDSPLQDAVWEKLTPNFQTEVLIKPKNKWFIMGMMLQQGPLTNIESLAKALGMSNEEILEYFDPGVWHEWGKSPVEEIMVKDSKEHINQNIPVLERMIDVVKHLTGNHHYNQTVVYKFNNKIAVTHCAVIIKWWEKPKRVLTKNTIIDVKTIN